MITAATRPTPPETGENRNYRATVQYDGHEWCWRVDRVWPNGGSKIAAGAASWRWVAWQRVKRAVRVEHLRLESERPVHTRWFA